MTKQPFPTTHVADVDLRNDTAPWLVRSLWPTAAVGLISGPPKVGKTWLCLDLALSVSSATPCLGAFQVDQPGPALLYLAEDSLHSVRDRVEALCRHRGIGLHQADLHLITAPALKLDRDEDRERLLATVREIQPRLLLLDPFVRLHSQNENDSAAVAAILASLRCLQRECDVAVALVHHSRKNGGGGPPGFALRGSSDLYAWGDAYAYLARRDNTLRLSLEHRSHPSIEPVHLRLVSRQDGSGAHLELTQEPPSTDTARLEDLVLAELATGQTPLRRTHLRARLKVNNHRLGLTLQTLRAQGRVSDGPAGWSVVR